MLRRLFTLLSALSLLLCAAVAVLWAAGPRMEPGLTRYHAGGMGATALYADPHGLYLWRDDSHYGVDDSGEWRSSPILYHGDFSGVLGFGVGRVPPIQFTNGRCFRVPYWFLFAITAVLPGVWAVRGRQRRRRLRRGLCPRCGYDLRATPGRCPECGTPRAEGEPSAV